MENQNNIDGIGMRWPAFRLLVGLVALAMTGAVLPACEEDDDDPEDTDETAERFEVTIENVSPEYDYFESGAFTTPQGEAGPGPLLPGQTYAFTLHAAPGHKVTFATMMVQSNDLFYAPTGAGIDLYDGSGVANSGDLTAMMELFDAGTEVNQEPGVGLDQAPRQSGANTGDPDTDDTVRVATDDFNNLPAIADVISVELVHDGDDTFTVSITNVSDDTTLSHTGGTSPVPLAPGAWVVHSGDNPLFTLGMPDLGLGLEAIAEDGDPTTLAGNLASNSGLTHIFAPGVWALHTAAGPLFEEGQSDAGIGLEALAEDGNPADLAANADALETGAFDTPVGASEAGVLTPGARYSFEFEAMPGEMLSIATMLVQSNDLFLAPDEMGFELFDADDMAQSGDVSDLLDIWDAGTEVNQRPGTGPDQAPRQAAANTGAAEDGLVQLVDDSFSYPAANDLLKVTITAL